MHISPRRTAAAAGVLALLIAAPASAQTASVDTVTAIGSATVKPTPADRTSNASILAAVRAAKREAIPRAIGDARARALLLAASGRLQLGGLVGVADAQSSQFFSFGPYADGGTFGPSRFCGTVTRYKTTRLANGRIKRTANGKHRVCRIPTFITATEAVTYAATPLPG